MTTGGGIISEAEWEATTLDEFGWPTAHGPALYPGAANAEREDRGDLLLPERLRAAIRNLNPDLPPDAVEHAFRIATDVTDQDSLGQNRRMHEYLVKGIREVTYTDQYGALQRPTIRLIDLVRPENNDFLAVNQVTVKQGSKHIRLDIVGFVNGMPLVFIELKKAADPDATIETGYDQLQRYRREFPLIFRYNFICLTSDAISARYGTAFGAFEHWAPWNVDEEGFPIDITTAVDFSGMALGIALNGLFERRRMLDLLAHFVNFTKGKKDPPSKRIVKPHQYFAVTKAVRKLVEASREDGRAGVVWHTQGSGKSEEMTLTAALAMTNPALGNPTILVVTDRIDLDDQLYNTFDDSSALPQEPKPITTRQDLRSELSNRTTGGILFAKLQLFGRTGAERKSGARHPLLSERNNVIVMVDEAHRSHYDTLDGYARHIRDALPKAIFIAFTGTPISGLRDTQATFGEYIDVYDLRRAVDDGATVKVVHDSRMVALQPSGEFDEIDERAAQIEEGLDPGQTAEARRAAATLDTIYGAPARVAQLAEDLVVHWEERRERMRPFISCTGKGMIVCVSRETCVRMYDAIVALRPDWADPDPAKGKIKIVYSGDSKDNDPKTKHIYAHLLKPAQRRVVQNRAKDPDDELELLIVCDMLLTGYDAPPLHTMYMDKPLHGANLMQAIARVNRRFRDKTEGLLVGYAPLKDKLHQALAAYTRLDGSSEQDDPTMGASIQRAVDEVRDRHENICRMLHSYDWRSVRARNDVRGRHESAVLGLVNWVRAPENQHPDGTAAEPLAVRFRTESVRLEQCYALCSTRTDRLDDVIDDIGFFTEARIWMLKYDAEERRSQGLPTPRSAAFLLHELAEQAIEAPGVTDLYAEAGLPMPDLSHLDEAYLRQLQESATPHLHAEMLRNIVQRAMRNLSHGNITRVELFSERLRNLMRAYYNQHISSAEVLQRLLELAVEISGDGERRNQFDPPLNDYELAYFDVLAENESALREMGGADGLLAKIAREIVRTVHADIKTDWQVREEVQAKLRTTVRRILRRNGYPPDKVPGGAEGVLRQLEVFADELSQGL